MKGSTRNTILIVCVLTVCWYLFYSSHTCSIREADVYIQGSIEDKALKGQFENTRISAIKQTDFKAMVIPSSWNASFDYKAAMQKLNEAKVNADDPRLIKLIRDYYIIPPSNLAYNLDFPDQLEYSNGQTPFVDSRLNYMEGGFYIECGALNGEKGSNTLFFEKVRKWNGLLVEADPSNFEALKSKHRKAFIINACLNTKPYPAVMTFNKAFNRGRIIADQQAKNWVKQQNIPKDEIQIQCFPLHSLLLALNQMTVDFFSLDVEGEELNVLKTIPWDKVNIKMMTVEYVHEEGGSDDLKNWVESKGYDSLLRVTRWDGGVNDIIFRKKGLTH